MNAFSLHILTAFKPFFDGECLSLVVPPPSGLYRIHPKHTALPPSTRFPL